MEISRDIFSFSYRATFFHFHLRHGGTNRLVRMRLRLQPCEHKRHIVGDGIGDISPTGWDKEWVLHRREERVVLGLEVAVAEGEVLGRVEEMGVGQAEVPVECEVWEESHLDIVPSHLSRYLHCC